MHGGNCCEFRRERVRLIRRERELEERNCGHREGGVSGGTVDEHRAGDGNTAPGLDNVCTFDDAAAARDDVFRDENFFTRRDFKVAAQNEFVVFLFRKNETDTELARDFLPDDQSAHCGREDGFDAEAFQFRQKEFDEAGDLVHILANLCTLKIVRAVQTAAQDKMPGEKGFAFFKNIEDFFLDLRIHSGGKYARSRAASQIEI